MRRKRLSLLGIITCLIAIGYLGGLFTNERHYVERADYEECPEPWAQFLPEKPENYNPDDPLADLGFSADTWWESALCEDEQKAKGVKPTIYKDNCPDNYQGDDRLRLCDTEQVFDLRGTLLTILVVALGLLVLLYRRSD